MSRSIGGYETEVTIFINTLREFLGLKELPLEVKQVDGKCACGKRFRRYNAVKCRACELAEKEAA